MSAAVSYAPDVGPGLKKVPPARRKQLRFTLFAIRVLGLRLTRGQRVASEVAFDGRDPIDLSEPDRSLALEMFGGAERIPALVRSILITVLRFGRWSGKSLLAAAHGVYRMITADLSGCGPGDLPAVLVVSPRRVTSRIVLRAALALVLGSPLAPLVTARGADGFRLMRPDGREVTFATVAKSAGGSAARGFSLIEFIFDESEFLPAADPSAAITDTAILQAVMPRLLEGGHVILISTPWPAESTTAELFNENFGHPSTALAARASTLVMRDQDPKLARKIAIERARDEANALREYDCINTDAAGCFFEASNIDLALVKSVAQTKRRASAGIDLAFRSDSSALVITERQGVGSGEELVAVYLELVSPKPGKPLKPSVVVQSFATTAIASGCGEFVADSHYIESAREHAAGVIVGETCGMTVVSGPSMTGDKDDSFVYLRALFREHKVKISDARLAAQLKSVQGIPLPGGGTKIVLPRRTGSGHADLVSGFVNAAWHDRRHGLLLRPAHVEMPTTIPGPYESGSDWMVR